MRFDVVVGIVVIGLLWGCGSDSDSGGSGGAGATGGVAGGGAGGSGGVAGVAGSSAGSGVAGSSGTPCTLASSWEVVDDFVLSPGENSFPVGIAADTAGNVYAVGIAQQSGAHGIVRRGTNAGTAWTTVSWGEGLPNDVAVDDVGNVYVAVGFNGRVVRKSADQGGSWTDIDSYPLASSDPNEPCGTGFVATGPNGVIVTGASCDFSGWIVRKSTNGTDFAQVFGFQLTPGKKARLERVGVGPNGAAFGAGSSLDATDVAHWMTVTEGASKTGVVSDDFQLTAGQNAGAHGFEDGEEPIVTGYATAGLGAQGGGVVRRLSGGTWITIDSFGTMVRDALRVSDQVIVVSGLQQTTAGIDQVVTRISTDGGASFGPLDAEYSYVAGKHTRGGALARDGAGNVYAAIRGQDAADAAHWIIRRLACEGT